MPSAQLFERAEIVPRRPALDDLPIRKPEDLNGRDAPSHQRLLDHVPGFATAFRTGVQRHSAAKDERIVGSLSATAEERYVGFLRVYPSIAARVPQTMLASYLGVTPETISRIRKHLSRR